MLDLQLSALILPAALPLALLFGALYSGTEARWRVAQWLSGGVLALAAAWALVMLTAWRVEAPWLSQPTWWLSLSGASVVLAVLVAFLGVVIVRFSRRYLAGEPGQDRYLRMLLATLAAVMVVVLTNHMLILAAGWALISLFLHRLLLFYDDRPRAAIAAHKKFILARIAEACLLAAFVLLWHAHGTWQISDVVAASMGQPLTLQEHLAVGLLAAAALIKCAQLPVHGWLIQVVEAPTPVSALLHAGVINLGGYLLIVFGPLLAQAAPAQWLLLLVAGPTAVLASLVMATRISIKVKLAWSTTAQMGLMLVECALGLYELALLHLVGHSCYKAHAFLKAGSAVEQEAWRRYGPAPAMRAGVTAAAVAGALGLVVAAALTMDAQGPWAPWLLLALALSVVLSERRIGAGRWPVMAVAGRAALLLGAYLILKAAFGGIVEPVPVAAGAATDLWMLALLLGLAAGYVLLGRPTHGPVARRLWVWLFAGFYLDEWFTRTTLRIWPLHLPAALRVKRLHVIQEEVAS